MSLATDEILAASRTSQKRFDRSDDGRTLLTIRNQLTESMLAMQNLFDSRPAESSADYAAWKTRFDEQRRQINRLRNQQQTLYEKQTTQAKDELRTRQRREQQKLFSLLNSIDQAAPDSARRGTDSNDIRKAYADIAASARKHYYLADIGKKQREAAALPDNRFTNPMLSRLFGFLKPDHYRFEAARVLLDWQNDPNNAGKKAAAKEKLIELLDRFIGDEAVEPCVLNEQSSERKKIELIRKWEAINALDFGIDFSELIGSLQLQGIDFTTDETARYEKNQRFVTETIRQGQEIMEQAMNPLPDLFDLSKLSWLDEETLKNVLPESETGSLVQMTRESVRAMQKDREEQLSQIGDVRFYGDPDCQQPMTQAEVNDRLKRGEIFFASKQLSSGTYTLTVKNRTNERVFNINNEETRVSDLTVTKKTIRLLPGETPSEALARFRTGDLTGNEDMMSDSDKELAAFLKSDASKNAEISLDEDFDQVVLPMLSKNSTGLVYSAVDMRFGVKERTVPTITEKVGWFSQKMFDWFGYKTDSYSRHENQVRAHEEALIFNRHLRQGHRMIDEAAETYDMDIGDEESYRRQQTVKEQIRDAAADDAAYKKHIKSIDAYIRKNYSAVCEEKNSSLLSMTDQQTEDYIAALDRRLAKDRQDNKAVPDGLTGKELFTRLHDLQLAASARSSAAREQTLQEYRNHHISAEEYNSLPPTDTENWKKLKNGQYEDKLWRRKMEQISILKELRQQQQNLEGIMFMSDSTKRESGDMVRSTSGYNKAGSLELKQMEREIAREKPHQEALNGILSQRAAAVARERQNAYALLARSDKTSAQIADAVVTVMAAVEARDMETFQSKVNALKASAAYQSYALPCENGESRFEEIASAMNSFHLENETNRTPAAADAEGVILNEFRAWADHLKTLPNAEQIPPPNLTLPVHESEAVTRERQQAYDKLSRQNVTAVDAADAMLTIMSCVNAADERSVQENKQTLRASPAFAAYNMSLPERNNKTLFQINASTASYRAILDKGARRSDIVLAEKKLVDDFRKLDRQLQNTVQNHEHTNLDMNHGLQNESAAFSFNSP